LTQTLETDQLMNQKQEETRSDKLGGERGQCEGTIERAKYARSKLAILAKRVSMI